MDQAADRHRGQPQKHRGHRDRSSRTREDEHQAGDDRSDQCAGVLHQRRRCIRGGDLTGGMRQPWQACGLQRSERPLGPVRCAGQREDDRRMQTEDRRHSSQAEQDSPAAGRPQQQPLGIYPIAETRQKRRHHRRGSRPDDAVHRHQRGATSVLGVDE
jgi:hypothetical protein